MSFRTGAAALLGVFLTGTGSAHAQTSAPQHQHYERAEAVHQPAPDGSLAPRLQNLGVHTFKVTTKSSRAQQFMNQGLNLVYGFNHAEAGRAFAEAARLDPACAMAYWGQALVLGPNINATMNPDDEKKAFALVEKAVSLKRGVTARERDYIDALAKRYTGKAEDRQAADRAFAEAMRGVAKKHPKDLDAATRARRMRSEHWNGSWPQIRVTRVRCTTGSISGSQPRYPNAPRRRPIGCCR